MSDTAKAQNEAPRLNIYQCQSCYGLICTVDRDKGVTPFMVDCKVKSGCSGPMRSSMYRVFPMTVPTWEWYRPTTTEDLSKPAQEHVDKGGLLLRKITTEADMRAIAEAARRAALGSTASNKRGGNG